MEYITKEEVTREFKSRSEYGYHYVRADRYVAAESGKEALDAISYQIEAERRELQDRLKQLDKDEELYNSLIHEGVKRMFANR